MARATRRLATERPLAIEQEYGRAAKADFSRTILEACPALLAVSTIQAITWSDLGTPPKVRQALQIMASRKIDAAYPHVPVIIQRAMTDSSATDLTLLPLFTVAPLEVRQLARRTR